MKDDWGRPPTGAASPARPSTPANRAGRAGRAGPTGPRPGVRVNALPASAAAPTHPAERFLIATGGAFGLGAAGTAESHSHPGVRFLPVPDAPGAVVYLAHPAHPTHPRTEDFLTVIREVVSGQ